MLSITEAEAEIRSVLPTLPTEDCPIENAHGRILRDAIVADRELPPFDRVTLDGLAIRYAALEEGRREFASAGTQPAGSRPLELADPESSGIEIMTGAVLPGDCDTVVPVEDLEPVGSGFRIRKDARVVRGQGVHPKGSDTRADATLVPSGCRLTGKEIAIAAACGHPVLRVSARPAIAVVATGDELVDVASPVASHQIRRSNDYALAAALAAAGHPRAERHHWRDHRHEIDGGLQRILAAYEVIILCGGVSRGKFDHLPDALAAHGVVKLFHGVAQRPGKPFWFGVGPRKVPVFALPGNPVSAFTCLHRYVLPALDTMSRAREAAPEVVPLSAPVHFSPQLAYLPPVKLQFAPDGTRKGLVLHVNTSGDFTSLASTDGFVELPASLSNFPIGYPAPFRPWR